MAAAPLTNDIKYAVDPSEQIVQDLDDGKRLHCEVIDPVTFLTSLEKFNLISADERDAGSIYTCLASIAHAELPPANQASYSWREADGKWLVRQCQVKDARKVFHGAESAIKTAPRLRTVNRVLAMTPGAYDVSEHASLSSGLEDLAKHFFGSSSYMSARTVIVPKLEAPTKHRLSISAANDNHYDVDSMGEATRIKDWPLAKLLARDVIQDHHYAAGMRYYQDWYNGGLKGIGAIDYGKVMGSGSDASSMPRSEREANARHAYRKARELLSDIERKIVEAVVLEERTLEEIRGSFGQRGTGSKRREETRIHLISGLTSLAYAYGQLRKAA